MGECVLAVIPLPMDVTLAVQVLEALSERFPGAVVRDGAHSGTYIPHGPGRLPVRTMELLLPDGLAPASGEEER